jgi:hypothetical protein
VPGTDTAGPVSSPASAEARATSVGSDPAAPAADGTPRAGANLPSAGPRPTPTTLAAATSDLPPAPVALAAAGLAVAGSLLVAVARRRVSPSAERA